MAMDSRAATSAFMFHLSKKLTANFVPNAGGSGDGEDRFSEASDE